MVASRVTIYHQLPANHCMPAISLIIGVWNRARYVGNAIKSVLNQTRTDFELIVCDDGSTDESLKIAREAASSDKRVRVFAGQNQGLPNLINNAVKLT